jgi:hypothetical protein
MKEEWKDCRDAEREQYNNAMHRLGRIGTCGAILIMLGMPTVLGVYFDALPTVEQIFRAAFPLLVVFFPSGLFEVVSYTPIFGYSIYLALISGEVLTIKLPAVNSVMRIMNLEAGSEEADVVATVTVCVASFVTMAVITLGIVLMIPLQPVLTSPAVQTASSHILPALLGALSAGFIGHELGGGFKVYGRLKAMILPIALMLAILFWDPQISAFLHLDELLQREGQGVIMQTFQGFVLIVIVLVTYFFNKWLYARGHIRVVSPAGDSIAPAIKQ